MNSKENIPTQYLDLLNSKGRSLHSIGSNEIALNRAALVEALKALKGKQVAILGVSILRVVDGKPEYNFDGWHSDLVKDHSFSDYAEKSWQAAFKYLGSYPDNGDDTILYAITLADEDWLFQHHRA